MSKSDKHEKFHFFTVQDGTDGPNDKQLIVDRPHTTFLRLLCYIMDPHSVEAQIEAGSLCVCHTFFTVRHWHKADGAACHTAQAPYSLTLVNDTCFSGENGTRAASFRGRSAQSSVKR